jgi:hypothetical protein
VRPFASVVTQTYFLDLPSLPGLGKDTMEANLEHHRMQSQLVALTARSKVYALLMTSGFSDFAYLEPLFITDIDAEKRDSGNRLPFPIQACFPRMFLNAAGMPPCC